MTLVNSFGINLIKAVDPKGNPLALERVQDKLMIGYLYVYEVLMLRFQCFSVNLGFVLGGAGSESRA